MKTTALALFLAATTLVAQDPAPPPAADVITLPDCAHVLAPTNVPVVGEADLVVFDSDKEVLVLTSPPGLATVTKRKGPMAFAGRFIDTGKVETKDYTKAWVYQVKPVPGASGRVEVLVVPIGAKDEKLVARKLYDIGGPKPDPNPNPGPAPGPQPPPNPGPTPPPPAPAVPMTGIVFIEETDAAQTARNTFLNDPQFVKRRQEKGIKFRTADKDVVGPDGRPPADLVEFLDKAKTKAYPQVFFVGYKDGKRITLGQFDLPKSIPDLLNLMSQYGG